MAAVLVPGSEGPIAVELSDAQSLLSRVAERLQLVWWPPMGREGSSAIAAEGVRLSCNEVQGRSNGLTQPMVSLSVCACAALLVTI
jgi:hypothetical protein